MTPGDRESARLRLEEDSLVSEQAAVINLLKYFGHNLMPLIEVISPFHTN